MKICFVGGGNISQAIIDGLLKSQLPPEAIVCIERNQEKIDLLENSENCRGIIRMLIRGCI